MESFAFSKQTLLQRGLEGAVDGLLADGGDQRRVGGDFLGCLDSLVKQLIGREHLKQHDKQKRVLKLHLGDEAATKRFFSRDALARQVHFH